MIKSLGVCVRDPNINLRLHLWLILDCIRLYHCDCLWECTCLYSHVKQFTIIREAKHLCPRCLDVFDHSPW